MRLSVAEAAARLGISPRAVRDRLKRGVLAGELVSAKSGATWLVDWQGEADGENADLRALIGETVGEAVSEAVGASMRESVAPIVAHGEAMARENERLRAQVMALENEAREGAAGAESAADGEPNEASRSWWRR